MGRVEAVDDVIEADRPAALEPGDEGDDPQRAERIAGLGDDVGGRSRLGRPAGARPEGAETRAIGGDEESAGIGSGISEESSRNWTGA